MHNLIRNRLMHGMIAFLIISVNTHATMQRQSLRVIREDNDLVLFLRDLESALLATSSQRNRSEILSAGLRHLEQTSRNLPESLQLENLNLAIIDTESVLRRSQELLNSPSSCQSGIVFEQFDMNNSHDSDGVQTLPRNLRDSYSRLIRAACRSHRQ